MRVVDGITLKRLCKENESISVMDDVDKAPVVTKLRLSEAQLMLGKL